MGYDNSDLVAFDGEKPAQEVYDEFLNIEYACVHCSSDKFKFSQVTKWGEEGCVDAMVCCPFCYQSIRIEMRSDIQDKIVRLAEIDKAICKLIINYFDRGGKLGDSPQMIDLNNKCITLMKHSPSWNSQYKPLSYTDRVTMLSMYTDLRAAEEIAMISVYSLLAPVMIKYEPKPLQKAAKDMIRKPKKQTFSGLGIGKGGGRKTTAGTGGYGKIKKTAEQPKLTFGFGKKKAVKKDTEKGED